MKGVEPFELLPVAVQPPELPLVVLTGPVQTGEAPGDVLDLETTFPVPVAVAMFGVVITCEPTPPQPSYPGEVGSG